MSFRYVSVDDAIAARGLRMVVVGNVPSPWGEAAKGFFHLKKLDWLAVRLVYDSEALVAWSGARNAPVVVYDDEPPRTGWEEILLLVERLGGPALLPADDAARARALKLAGICCKPEGLGWSRRLQQVQAARAGRGGFSERVAGYLGKKYGYDAEHTPDYGARVRECLASMAAALRAGGGDYYLGTLTAVDVYSAVFMALFAPLPEEQCRMDPGIREAFSLLDEETRAALDPALLAHRDRMYARHLATPLSL